MFSKRHIPFGKCVITVKTTGYTIEQSVVKTACSLSAFLYSRRFCSFSQLKIFCNVLISSVATLFQLIKFMYFLLKPLVHIY